MDEHTEFLSLDPKSRAEEIMTELSQCLLPTCRV